MRNTASRRPLRAHPESLPYIASLDGVRGVAIALVLAYHFGVPGVRGGFLGVDLFFVLSGFLITTLLLDEHRATGRIDLVQFWFRRGRRLLPALFVLIGAVAIWAATGATAFEKGPLRWDLLASLGYVANWRFIAAGQSYFAEFSTASPLRHLWSLAIEEQFYVIWPLVIAGAGAWLAHRGGYRQAAIAALLAGAIISALVMAVTYNEADPSLSYYSTLARAHELLIGAASAALAGMPRFREAAARHAGSAAAIGLGGVLLGGMLMNDRQPFYYIGGAVIYSVLAAVLILSLVVGRSNRFPVQHAISARPLVWLGAISYGVYLWHWPLVVWLRPDTIGLDGVALFVFRLAATLLIAGASFWLIERPIRRGTVGRIRLRPLPALVGASVAFMVLGLGSALATRGSEPPPAFLSEDPVLKVHLVPDQRATIGLVGDSVALSLYPGLWRVGEERQMSTVSAAVAGCGVGQALRVDDDGTLGSKTERCAETIPALQSEMIRTYDPDVIFWHSQRDRPDIRLGSSNLEAPTPGWREALFADWDATLERLRSGGATVVLVPPFFAERGDPAKCAGEKGLATQACVDPVMTNAALRTIYLEWAARHDAEELLVMDEAMRLCPSAPCPAVLEGVNLRRDTIHFSSGGAALISGWLLDSLPSDALPATSPAAS